MKAIIIHFFSELDVSIAYMQCHSFPLLFLFSEIAFLIKRIAFNVEHDNVRGVWVKIVIDTVFERSGY